MKHIEVNILRYDPSKDESPYYQYYKIAANEPMTIMEILTYIYRHLDSTLAFRTYFCYRGTCSSCLVKVNKKIVRGCSSMIQPGAQVYVEPYLEKNVIRDLVVDFNKRKRFTKF